jgi:two-component system, OmpR family, phosphate regulon response regulator OmpR
MKSRSSFAVLLIDDDGALARMLSEYLSSYGLEVDWASEAETGLEKLKSTAPDVVVLDVMLPGIDGFGLLPRIRAASDVPILMLTARGEDADRIVGLELGADDYLGKPFNPRELVARLRALVRRERRTGRDSGLLRFGTLTIDRTRRQVHLDGEERPLTGHQFDLLVALAENAGKVMTRDRLLRLVRGTALEPFDRSIDVHISRIRAAVEEDPASPRRILTIRGVGYVFVSEESRAEG